MDTLARALVAAADLIEEGRLPGAVEERYAGWQTERGQSILQGKRSLAELWQETRDRDGSPAPTSGRQELLESWVRAGIERSR